MKLVLKLLLLSACVALSGACDAVEGTEGDADAGGNNTTTNANIGDTDAGNTGTNVEPNNGGNSLERIGETAFDGEPSVLDWDGGTTFAKLAAGNAHNCVLYDGGGLKCWGENGAFPLGVEGSGATPVTNTVPTKGSGVADVSAGANFTCALLDDDTVECWGRNLSGQLGRAEPSESFKPLPVPLLDDGIAGVAAGDGFACAWYAAGGASCWGLNAGGELGRGTVGDNSGEELPDRVTDLDVVLDELVAGNRRACALADGAVLCWGDGGLLDDSTTPQVVTGLEADVTDIAMRNGDLCAVQAGNVFCIGDNQNGQLGVGDDNSRPGLEQMQGLPTAAVQVAVATDHNCALLDDDSVWCVGTNDEGQLGRGTTSMEEVTPAAVDGLSGSIEQIVAGNYHTCVRYADGTADCWGYNLTGRLGDGTDTDRTTPVALVNPEVVQ